MASPAPTWAGASRIRHHCTVHVSEAMSAEGCMTRSRGCMCTRFAKESAYVCETAYASFGVPSHHPVRSPGPKILEKEALETALPKPSAPCLSAPPSRYLSTSTIRGRLAFSIESVLGVRLEGHWRKSYTSSVMIRASYCLARRTSCSLLRRLIVLELGFEKAGTA